MEVLELAKGGEHIDKKIVENFWKAFIKLL